MKTTVYRDSEFDRAYRTAFFVGFPFVAIVVNIPQRAQAVAGQSPVNAGLGLLPMMLSSPLATALSGYLTSNAKVPPFYLVVVGSVLQLIGVGLTCSLPTDTTTIAKAQYGFEAIMGVGFGLGLTTLLTFARVVVPEPHMGEFLRFPLPAKDSQYKALTGICTSGRDGCCDSGAGTGWNDLPRDMVSPKCRMISCLVLFLTSDSSSARPS